MGLDKFLLGCLIVGLFGCGKSRDLNSDTPVKGAEEEESSEKNSEDKIVRIPKSEKTSAREQEEDKKEDVAKEEVEPDEEEKVQDTKPAQEVNDAGEVVFRIKEGTGTGNWNTKDNPIRIKPGQTLRVFNDDSRSHTIHTNSFSDGALPRHGCERAFQLSNIPDQGVACKFGTNLQPGLLDSDEIHDHFTWQAGSDDRGIVFIEVIAN